MKQMNETKQNGVQKLSAEQPRPIFSICHATARPGGWQESARAWLSKAKHPEQVEYVLCIDERWGFPKSNPLPIGGPMVSRIVWNEGRRCMVDGFNTAARAATGQILILNSDDMFPPDGWDVTLQRLIRQHRGLENAGPEVAFAREFVIQVSSGTPADERGLMVLQILSRARYERLGYALYPKYESLFADDDFSEHARHDDVVIDARHITVEHRHPDWNPAIARDAVYDHENAPEVWKRGNAIYQKRLASGFDDDFELPEDDDVEDAPLFSIVHASARPGKWRAIFEAWMGDSRQAYEQKRKTVEYILVVDERWGFSTEANHLDGPDKIVWNDQRRCCVDAWNLGAKQARGKVIILAADDVTPPEDWGRLLLEALAADGRELDCESPTCRDFAIAVKTGTEAVLNEKPYPTGLLMLSKHRYDRLGYALAPDYTGMFSDIEFWLHASDDKAIIWAMDLEFKHDHPILRMTNWKNADPVYAAQNADEDYVEGERLFRARAANNWQSLFLPAGAWAGFDPTRKTIAVCLPGEHFCSEWVCGWTGLLTQMLSKFNVIPAFFTYSSNVYVTRNALYAALLKALPKPDYVLWLDDDNVLRMDQLEMLIADMEAFPNAAGIAGWTLVQPKGVKELAKATLSAGMFDTGPVCYPVTLEALDGAREAGQLIEVGYFGFPAVIMRYDHMLKAGANPFSPLDAPGYGYGFMGEDAAFCYRLQKNAPELKFYVEPRIQLPHYKLADVGGQDIKPLLAKKE